MREHNLFFQTRNAIILKDTANGDCVFLAFVFTLTGTFLLPLWYSSMSSACHWSITRCRRQVEFKAILSLHDRGVFGCPFSLPGRREATTKNTSIAQGKPFFEFGFVSIWFFHADESYQGRNSCMREWAAVRMRLVSIPGACIVKRHGRPTRRVSSASLRVLCYLFRFSLQWTLCSWTITCYKSPNWRANYSLGHRFCTTWSRTCKGPIRDNYQSNIRPTQERLQATMVRYSSDLK